MFHLPDFQKIMAFASRRKSLLSLAILLIAGYVGNYFSLSLFFGVDFLFGSIAVLLVIRLFGLGWGVLAAAIAGGYTYFLWNHPYAAIITVCEALFVGWLLRYKHRNLVLLDGVYWIFIGMPLVWVFYFGMMHVDMTQALLVMLKQSVNGIFNALIANLLITYAPLQQWAGRPQLNKKLSLQQTLLNLLVAFVFFPVLMLMVGDSHLVMSNIETTISRELQTTSDDLMVDLHLWHERRLRALTELAQVAFAESPTLDNDPDQRQERLQQNIEVMQRVFPDFDNVYFANPQGRVVAAYPRNRQNQLVIGAESINRLIGSSGAISTIQRPLITGVYSESVSLVPRIGLGVPYTRDGQVQGIIYAALDLSYLQSFLKTHLHGRELQLTLIDQGRHVVSSTQPQRQPRQIFDRSREGLLRVFGSSKYQWLPDQGNLPPMVGWKQSFYGQETAIGEGLSWTLIVESPAAPYVNQLQSLYIKDLTIMLVIALLALVSADLLSRRLIGPLLTLAQVTTNLPSKLSDRESINWPQSPVTEIDSLVHNFRSMAIALNQKFQEIQSANETLEQRVQRRTNKLIRAIHRLKDQIIERKRAEMALQKARDELELRVQERTAALQSANVELRNEISERKRAEEERNQLLVREQKARMQAETASRMKDEFLAIVSHELRTPLNSILGWAQLLRSREIDSKMLERALEVIERNARSQAQLIEDILEISRIIRGQLRLHIVNVDLVRVIEGALETVRPAADAKSLCLTTHLSPDVQPIAGDPDRLKQVVWNLLSNAVKFTPEGGQITLSLDREDGYVQIRVSDTGEGISPDFLPYVFDYFRQADASITRLYGGLGLGLSIVRRMVELHGGTVAAESPGKGQGAVFTVSLPCKLTYQSPQTEQQPTISASLQPLALNKALLKGLNLLIVDDDSDTLDFLRTVLQQSGANVIALESAEKAFKSLTWLWPDVLISDIGMPETDGYTFIQQVQALATDQGKNLPAIALTAYARAEDRLQALAAGFQIHVAKPVEATDLIMAILQLTGRDAQDHSLGSVSGYSPSDPTTL